MEGFIESIRAHSVSSKSNVIAALDSEGFGIVDSFLRVRHAGIAGIKVHEHNVLSWGFSHEDFVAYVKGIDASLPIILDLKLADIDFTNLAKAKYYFSQGYDAVTAHAFQGEAAVKGLLDYAKEHGKGVLLIAALSSQGNMLTDEQVREIVSIGSRGGAAGFIAPGNDYQRLRMIKSLAGAMPIFSPGIGAQGGDAEEAGKYADYLIVGRSLLKGFAEEAGGAARTADPRLIDLLVRSDALKFGDFKLKSGRESAYFFTIGNISDGEGIKALGEAYADAIMRLGIADDFDLVFGPAYKGISLAAVASYALYAKHGISKRFAYDRKDVKDHGLAGESQVVGRVGPKDRVLILDDVITTGGTKVSTIEKLKSLFPDISVYGVLVFLDREEKDMEGNDPKAKLEASGVKVFSVLTASRVFEMLKASYGPEYLGFYERFMEHRKKYGVG